MEKVTLVPLLAGSAIRSTTEGRVIEILLEGDEALRQEFNELASNKATSEMSSWKLSLLHQRLSAVIESMDAVVCELLGSLADGSAEKAARLAGIAVHANRLKSDLVNGAAASWHSAFSHGELTKGFSLGLGIEHRLPSPFYSLHSQQLGASVFEEGLRLLAVWASQLPEIESALVNLAIASAVTSENLQEKWPEIVSRVAANDNPVQPEVREFVLSILMELLPSRTHGLRNHG